MRSILVHNFDEDLLLEFQSITSVSRIWPDGDFYVDLDFDIATQYNEGGNRYFQAWNSSLTEVIDRSPFIESTDSQWPLPVAQLSAEPVFANITVGDKSVRVVIQKVDAQWGWVEQQPDLEVADDVKEFSLVLMVGRDRDSLSKALFELRVWTLLVGMTLVIFNWVIVNVLVARGMKMFVRMSDRIDKIATTDDTLPEDDSWPEEIKPVVETLNQLLSRIDTTVQRMRRFTGDAAHELRTPLAELRLVTDVALRSTENQERLVEAVAQANHVSHSMANTVNAMLQLARFQSGHYQFQASQMSIELTSFIQDIVRQQTHAMSEKNQQVIFEPKVAFTRELDVDLSRMIFNNLMSNAINYAPEGTVIRIELEPTAKGYFFVIENEAVNIEQADLVHFTEPFWRKGESRHQRDHVGLGLALVNEACQVMNLSMQFSLINTHRLRCTITQ
jgi:two-component system sensor histidine kinase QseC